MNLLIVKSYLAFLVITAILWMERPLFMTISDGLVTALMLYDIPVADAVVIMGGFMTSRDTITVVLSLYFIASLQRMLECRDHLKQAEEFLDGLFSNRKTNASAISVVIGLLPSVGAMNLCAEVVKSSYEDYISREDMTTVTSLFYRIPECSLPTCSFILIALAVSGIGAGKLVAAMVPLAAVLFSIGYVFYLRKLPKVTGRAPKSNRVESVKMLVRSLWSILFIVVLVTAANVPVCAATPLVAVLSMSVDRLGMEEIRPMFRSAFGSVIIFNTILIMMFKDTVTSIGMIHELPASFGSLPIPVPPAFALIFLFGSIISDTNTITSPYAPMTMAAMPQGGVPSLVLFISSPRAAVQVSSTRICLFVIAEYLKVNIGELVEWNIPMIPLFFAAALGYTAALGVFWGKESKKYEKSLNRTFLHMYNDMACSDA